MKTHTASFGGQYPNIIQTSGDGDGVKVDLEERLIDGSSGSHRHHVADGRIIAGFDIEPSRFALARSRIVGQPIPLPVLKRSEITRGEMGIALTFDASRKGMYSVVPSRSSTKTFSIVQMRRSPGDR